MSLAIDPADVSTRLAIISDTHMPSREPEIPEWAVEKIRAADHTIHAGDYDAPEALETVRELAGGNLTAVTGNIDGPEIDLPEVATVDVEDRTFVVTHGTGDHEGYEERVAGIVREHGGDDAIGVSGHTHTVMDEVVEDLQLLNPGTVTGADPSDGASMMTATVDGDAVEVELHRE